MNIDFEKLVAEAIATAVEKRIGAAVLYGGGIAFFTSVPLGEQPFNYFPRITQPVLMLNGKFDTVFPAASQQRMFDLLGAPPARKEHVVFEGGHIILPRVQVQQLSLDWFDEYLGPAQPGTTAAAKYPPASGPRDRAQVFTILGWQAMSPGRGRRCRR